MSSKSLPIATIIGLLFGNLWGVIGSAALTTPWRALTLAVSILIGIALLIRLRRSPTPEIKNKTGGSTFRRIPYLLTVLFEFLAIATANILLQRHGATQYFPEALGIIVGLHFLGLWRATRSPGTDLRLIWVACAMVLLSAAALLLPQQLTTGVSPAHALTGFGNALVLWIAAGRKPSSASAPTEDPAQL